MEYINLKAQYQYLRNEIDERIQGCLQNADFIMGDAVERFEAQLAEYVGVRFAISCGSGTDALQLIYMAYHIGAGDAVFCPDMTFIASIEPACLLGATPVFCEIDKDTYNIDPEGLVDQIERVIKEGDLVPKAIIAVDFLGCPAGYQTLTAIAHRYNLLLIEDAAQAMGALSGQRKCGSFGDVAATSFFPSKPLGCYGDGGAVFTNDEEIAHMIRSLRVHGKGTTKYDNIEVGINSRLDTLQAEILSVKISHLETEIKRRQEIAKEYDESLKDYYKVPFVGERNRSAYAQYVVCTGSREERDRLRKYLQEREIPSIIYYPNPLHRLPVFQNGKANSKTYGSDFENTIQYAETNVGIPFSAYLTEEERIKITEALTKFRRG